MDGQKKKEKPAQGFVTLAAFIFQIFFPVVVLWLFGIWSVTETSQKFSNVKWTGQSILYSAKGFNRNQLKQIMRHVFVHHDSKFVNFGNVHEPEEITPTEKLSRKSCDLLQTADQNQNSKHDSSSLHWQRDMLESGTIKPIENKVHVRWTGQGVIYSSKQLRRSQVAKVMKNSLVHHDSDFVSFAEIGSRNFRTPIAKSIVGSTLKTNASHDTTDTDTKTTRVGYTEEHPTGDTSKDNRSAGERDFVPENKFPLHFAAQQGDDSEVVSLLAQNVVGVNSCDDYGRTPLWIACRYGQLNVVQALLDSSNISWSRCQDRKTERALSDSVQNIDMNKSSKDGETPLMIACWLGHQQIVELLLSHFTIDTDATDQHGRTASMIAKSYGHQKVAEMISSTRSSKHQKSTIECKQNALSGQDARESFQQEQNSLGLESQNPENRFQQEHVSPSDSASNEVPIASEPTVENDRTEPADKQRGAESNNVKEKESPKVDPTPQSGNNVPSPPHRKRRRPRESLAPEAETHCPICLEKLNGSDSVSIFQCSHQHPHPMHYKCIRGMLQQSQKDDMESTPDDAPKSVIKGQDLAAEFEHLIDQHTNLPSTKSIIDNQTGLPYKVLFWLQINLSGSNPRVTKDAVESFWKDFLRAYKRSPKNSAVRETYRNVIKVLFPGLSVSAVESVSDDWDQFRCCSCRAKPISVFGNRLLDIKEHYHLHVNALNDPDGFEKFLNDQHIYHAKYMCITIAYFLRPALRLSHNPGYSADFEPLGHPNLQRLVKIITQRKYGLHGDIIFQEGGHAMLMQAWACLPLLEALFDTQEKPNVNHINDDGDSALIVFLKKGKERFSAAGHLFNFDNINVLIKQKETNVNIANAKHESPLRLAAEYGYKKVVALLLERGAHVDGHPDALSTPLFIASARGHTDICSLLLDKKASIDATERVTDGGRTPLMIAALHGWHEVVNVLLNRGANVNVAGTVTNGENLKLTSLMLAAAENHREVVSQLLNAKASVDMTNANGCTALHYAIQYNKGKEHEILEICKLLVQDSEMDLVNVQQTTIVETKQQKTKTALMIASQKGYSKIVSFLLEHNAKISPRVSNSRKLSQRNWNAFHFALNSNNENSLTICSQLLQEVAGQEYSFKQLFSIYKPITYDVVRAVLACDSKFAQAVVGTMEESQQADDKKQADDLKFVGIFKQIMEHPELPVIDASQIKFDLPVRLQTLTPAEHAAANHSESREATDAPHATESDGDEIKDTNKNVSVDDDIPDGAKKFKDSSSKNNFDLKTFSSASHPSSKHSFLNINNILRSQLVSMGSEEPTSTSFVQPNTENLVIAK